MVHADTFQLDLLAIQISSLISRHLKITEAKLCLIGIHYFTGRLYFCADSIKRRVFRTPKAWVFRFHGCLYHLRLSSLHFLSLCCYRSNTFFCSFFENVVSQLHRRLLCTFILNRCLNVRCNIFRVRFQIRCFHFCSVQSHVNLIHYRQMYTSVDSASGIPTTGRGFMVNFDRNHIFLSNFHLICNIKRKRCITIRMCSHLFTVDIYRGIHIYTIKI